jgi:capsular polysaccharide biosynthesis protein
LATDVHQTLFARRVDALTAVRRHWFVAIFPIALFVAAAVVLGTHRTPRYTATASLSVGHVYVSDPSGIPTIIDATQSLAATYSRAIASSAVTQDTRRILRREKASAVSGRLAATPIPQSQLIKVTAQSSYARGAVALANAGALALASYVNGQIRDNDASATISERYLKASLAYRERLDNSTKLARRYANRPTRAKKAARDRAAAATDAAKLRRNALQAAYQTAVQGGTSSVGVEIFSTASGATSDRSRKMQLLVFVGLLGGLAAGAALALLRAARDIRRQGE